jgi:deoxyadenosine/deoxycytidine kinase
MEKRRIPKVIVLEGPIGAGKSTLLGPLAERLREGGLKVCEVPEPVERWVAGGVLEAFYKDPERYACAFQLHVLATRTEAINGAREREPAADVYLLERSPASDRIFWALQEGSLPDADKAIYEAWAAFWLPHCSLELKGAHAVYVRTPLEDCMARLAARGRPGEELVARAYQEALCAAHDAFLLGPGGPAPAGGGWAPAQEEAKTKSGSYPGLAPAPYARVVVPTEGALRGNYRVPGEAREALLKELVEALEASA